MKLDNLTKDYKAHETIHMDSLCFTNVKKIGRKGFRINLGFRGVIIMLNFLEGLLRCFRRKLLLSNETPQNGLFCVAQIWVS